MNTNTQQDNKPGAERRSFRMDPALLWSVIKSQAGTLDKALLEAVMNSIDAGATKVLVTLDSDRLIVEDDGRGFQSRKEIEDWFETFGTPHIEGDARWGQFRMGRGQLFAFTRNVWRSGEFQMRVDIRDLGLEYDLVEDMRLHKGCRVDGQLYESMQPSEVIKTVDSLRIMCKYTPVPVFVNGEQISLDPSKEKWSFEDEDAWYLMRESSRYLQVYNLGVHVRDYWNGQHGVGGVVVSKRRLSVNFARNDVLATECQVFKRISSKTRAYANALEKKAPAQNEAYRQMMVQRLLTGNFDTLHEYTNAVRDAKVFTDYSGKHLSLESMITAAKRCYGNVLWVKDYSPKVDRVHQEKLAVVLSPQLYERCGGLDFSEVLARLKINLKHFEVDKFRSHERAEWVLKRLEEALVDLSGVMTWKEDDYKIIPDCKLTKEERLTLSVINGLRKMVGSSICHTAPRMIKICESRALDGFTDGRSMIVIERKFLAVGGQPGAVFKAFERVKALLVHEYVHDSDTSTGHGHPAEFYERFHELMSAGGETCGFAYEATRNYLSARRKAGMKMRGGDLKTLDLVGVDEESSGSKDDASPTTELGATQVPSAREEAALQQELV